MSAPRAAACLTRAIVLCVDSHPQPAMNSFPGGMSFRAASKDVNFSASPRYGISPFVPNTAYPASGNVFHFRKLDASASRFTSPAASNGVGIGGKMPAIEAACCVISALQGTVHQHDKVGANWRTIGSKP